MEHKTGHRQKEVDLLNASHYSKLTCLIALGYNTQDKIREYRQNNEDKGLALAPAVQSNQLKALVATGAIKSTGKPLRYNRKEYEVDWEFLSEKFRQYVNGRSKAELERKTQDRFKPFKDPNLRHYKEVPPFDLPMQELFKMLFLEYIKANLLSDKSLIFCHTLKNHFDVLIRTIVLAWLEANIWVTAGEITPSPKLPLEFWGLYLACYAITFNGNEQLLSIKFREDYCRRLKQNTNEVRRMGNGNKHTNRVKP